MRKTLSAFQGAIAAVGQMVQAAGNIAAGGRQIQAAVGQATVAATDLRLVEQRRVNEVYRARMRYLVGQCIPSREGIFTDGGQIAEGPSPLFGLDSYGRAVVIATTNGFETPASPEPSMVPQHGFYHEYTSTFELNEEQREAWEDARVYITASLQSTHREEEIRAFFLNNEPEMVDIGASTGSRTAHLGREMVQVERRVADAAMMAEQALLFNDIVAIVRAIHRIQQNLNTLPVHAVQTVLNALDAGKSSARWWLNNRPGLHWEGSGMAYMAAAREYLRQRDQAWQMAADVQREPDNSLAEELFRQTDRAIIDEIGRSMESAKISILE